MVVPESDGKAVVLGAGIAGLLAGHVLSRRFADVVIVERDPMAVDTEARRGVPQGRHLHGLLAQGHVLLEDFFPGLTTELAREGAPTGDMLLDTRLCFGGHRFARGTSGLTTVCVRRPTLERAVRRRVEASAAVTLLTGHDVVGLLVNRSQNRVFGVSVARHGDPRTQELTAGLVVDATGRGSRLSRWLREVVHAEVPAELLPVDVNYVTREYRMRPEAMAEDLVILSAPKPGLPRGGAVSRVDAGRCLVTLIGMLGERPPTDVARYERYASRLALPDVGAALLDAEPLSEAVAHRHPTSVLRRFERLDGFPDGLAVLGDAVCSLNPVYGQGMTVAAMQAQVLGRHLDRQQGFSTRRYLREIAQIRDLAWSLASGADLAFPEVPGPRPASTRFLGSYVARVQAAAEHDPVAGRAFLRVTSLVDPPTSLFSPGLIGRVLHTPRPSAAVGP